MNCAVCGKEDAKTCSGCKLVGYCGTLCQKQDWSQHKLSCRQSKIKNVGADALAASSISGPTISNVNEKKTEDDKKHKHKKEHTNNKKEKSLVSDLVVGNQNVQIQPCEPQSKMQNGQQNGCEDETNICEDLMKNVSLKLPWSEFMEKIKSTKSNQEKISMLRPFFKWSPCTVSQKEQMINQKNSQTSKMFMCRAMAAIQAGAFGEALKFINMMMVYADNSTDLDLGQLMRTTCLENLQNLIKNKNHTINFDAKTQEFAQKLFTLESKNPSAPSLHQCVQINYDKDRGRGLIVTKDVPAGTTLLVERPFVAVSTELFSLKLSHCAHCYRTFTSLSPPITCPLCPFVLFCNSTCEKLAASYHQYECTTSAHIRSLLLKMKSSESSWLLAFRTICLLGPEKLFQIFQGKTSLDLNTEQPQEIYDPSSYANLYNLQGIFDPEEISPPLISMAMTDILNQSTSFFHQIPKDLQSNFQDFISRTILRHYKSFIMNALNLNQLEEEPLGLRSDRFGAAIYTTACLMNHTCESNVIHCWNVEGGEIAVRSARPLKKGEEICWSYCPNYSNKDKSGRQMELLEKYKFTCKCAACENDWPTLQQLKAVNSKLSGSGGNKCPANFCCRKCTKEGQGQFPISRKNGLKCPNCNSAYNEKKLIEELESHRRFLTEQNKGGISVEKVIKNLENASTFFHTNLISPSVEQALALVQMEFHIFRMIHALSKHNEKNENENEA